MKLILNDYRYKKLQIARAQKSLAKKLSPPKNQSLNSVRLKRKFGYSFAYFYINMDNF